MPKVENVRNFCRFPVNNLFSVEFFDETTGRSTLITPRENRVVIFSSGNENLINFKPVTKGYMSYFIFHFTCDGRRNVADNKSEDKKYLPFGPFQVPMAALDEYESDVLPEEGTRRL